MADEAVHGYTGNMEGIHSKIDEGTRPFPLGNWRTVRTQQHAWPKLEQEGYYLDGLVRLAYILHDEQLIAKVKSEIDPVIDGQESDGYFFHPILKEELYKSNLAQNLLDPILTTQDDGEESAEEAKNRKRKIKRHLPSRASRLLWSIAVFNRAVLALYDASGDKKYLDFLENYYQNFPVFEREVPEGYPISGTEMHFSRHLVNLEILFEVASRTNNDTIRQIGLATLKKHTSGMVDSWSNNNFSRTRIVHGVTFNELFKLYATSPSKTNPEYLQASESAYQFLKNEHIQAHGVNSANEYLRGVGGFTATELCDVVDLSWSLTWLARASGNAHYGDAIEQAFFNAFPAGIDRFQKHVYLLSPNRLPGIVNNQHRVGKDNFKHLYAPFCCTGNLNRALPNYIMHMAMRTPDSGLALLTYGPNEIQTLINSTPVKLTTKTEYPFRDRLSMLFTCDTSLTFPLYLRIPKWCNNYKIKINNKNINAETNSNGFVILNREWKNGDQIRLELPMDVAVHTGYEKKLLDKNGSEIYVTPGGSRVDSEAHAVASGAPFAYVTRGPLLYSLAFDERDANSLNATQPFNYAIKTHINQSQIRIMNNSIDGSVWNSKTPPIELHITAQQINWEFKDENNQYAAMPQKPYAENINNQRSIKLIPFGCAKFRLTYFPLIEK
ncbi:beta-L-arabinofuranosidase domain-containing protein [Poriferisphaera sp. WC338]|uniref:beta-L-arabinofuranosidase domain-containing protein n=1 Tax=Poriferisphaera sp. WC338 TaxID=3425129 RepID=UPI003D814B1D